ncbi:hypothetical protein M378DRAFT_858153 [Amanita muscaria Koide BX008]|uniref:RNA-polymerase II-associated protein 3-like C-terminal domain-containing protein n=1 Tax=Amanita muscaria (strain Koide BX008) TaxID=946122 RepID=A0A0C2WX22_AMAMK|nr:hypothetical protein M378DRAFT_858153 [Amanita muscaria Koide BX008]
MTPVSTRSLKSPSASSVPPTQLSQSKPKPPTTASIPTASVTSASTATLPPKPSQSNFAEAKATRDSSRPSHVGPSAGVGGGIFRPNGQNTTFSPRTQTSASASVSDTIREAQPPTNSATRFPLNIAIGNGSPMTMFNFNKKWEANPVAEDRWKLITSIPPTNIPSMCKSSLEPSLFISIVDLLRAVAESNSEQDKDTREVIKAYLNAFGGVPRLNTVLLFLSEKEKSRVRELWKLLGVENLSGNWNVLVR